MSIVQLANFSWAPIRKKQNVIIKHIQINLSRPKTDGKKASPLNHGHHTLDKYVRVLMICCNSHPDS